MNNHTWSVEDALKVLEDAHAETKAASAAFDELMVAMDGNATLTAIYASRHLIRVQAEKIAKLEAENQRLQAIEHRITDLLAKFDRGETHIAADTVREALEIAAPVPIEEE